MWGMETAAGQDLRFRESHFPMAFDLGGPGPGARLPFYMYHNVVYSFLITKTREKKKKTIKLEKSKRKCLFFRKRKKTKRDLQHVDSPWMVPRW